MDDLQRRIGMRAREARTALGLTQAEIAEEVGLATEVYGRLERGGMLPSVPTLVKLAAVLRVSPGDLLAAHGRAQAKRRSVPELQRLVRMLEKADRRVLKRVLVVVKAMVD